MTPTTRRLHLAGAMALFAGATAAHAIGVRSPVPVAVRGRLDVRVVALQENGAWDVTSRSPSDPSRFMADLTAGSTATGTLYLKGASRWRDSDDASGRVDFRLEQGDYRYGITFADSTTLEARLFGDERRFFTAELATPVVVDDDADDFEHRVGARLDAHAHAARATWWIAGLDDGDTRRINQYASARVATRPVYAGLGYVHDHPEDGDDHVVAKGELAASVWKATAIVSYEQSGFGRGAFLPSGSWGDLGAGGYAEASPDNSATYAELRTRRVRAGENHLFDAAYRYRTVGVAYTDDLSAARPGSVTHDAWIDWAHRRYALDARLELASREVRGAEEPSRRSIVATGRARLKDNAELLLRGGALRVAADPDPVDRHGFVHAAYTRELQGFLGGAHVFFDELGSDATASAGAEIRVNWNATSAVYARWIVTDAAGGSDAVFVRLELRPTRRTWVTVGYGREDRGDDVYFLEDRDTLPAADAADVVTLTVRGDL